MGFSGSFSNNPYEKVGKPPMPARNEIEKELQRRKGNRKLFTEVKTMVENPKNVYSKIEINGHKYMLETFALSYKYYYCKIENFKKLNS